MVVGIFVLLLVIGWIAVMNVQQQVIAPTIPSDLAKQFAGQFRAYSHANLAFAENNVGYNGSISNQQVSPYMSPWAIPSGGSAIIQGGYLIVWATPPGLSIPQEEWITKEMLDTEGDYAYAIDDNGTIVSPIVGNMGTAPAGIPNGSAIYKVVAPNN